MNYSLINSDLSNKNFCVWFHLDKQFTFLKLKVMEHSYKNWIHQLYKIEKTKCVYLLDAARNILHLFRVRGVASLEMAFEFIFS